jgi:hypothetical protein
MEQTMTLAEQVCLRLIGMADFEFQFDVNDRGLEVTASIESSELQSLVREAQSALCQTPNWQAPGYDENEEDEEIDDEDE